MVRPQFGQDVYVLRRAVDDQGDPALLVQDTAEVSEQGGAERIIQTRLTVLGCENQVVEQIGERVSHPDPPSSRLPYPPFLEPGARLE
jgi:hypothetical protein